MNKLIRLFFVCACLLYSAAMLAQSPAPPIRGFLIDAPRAPESLAYYFRLIDFCRRQGLNTILFRLTDDEGSAYRFSSHPELQMCRGAYSRDELRTLIGYAQRNGIELIPEVESFGHAKYILQSPAHRGLNDAVEGAEYNALSPVNDSSLQLMKSLFAEVAAIFPSKYLHIGCDETNWGGSVLSKAALKTRTRGEIWSDYVNRLNACVKALGKQTVIWGDMPVYHEQEALDLLDKDIVIAEWNYSERDPAVVSKIEKKLAGKGFRILGCPAVSWCKWGARVGGEQFGNVSAYASVYARAGDPASLGIVLTNWVPGKYLPYSQWDSYAIAAGILRNEGRDDRSSALSEFVSHEFGAAYDSGWARIFRILYAFAPQSNCADADSLRFAPWQDSAGVRALCEKGEPPRNEFSGLGRLLRKCRPAVKRNRVIFEDIATTVDFLAYLFERQRALVDFSRSRICTTAAVSKFLQKTAAGDAQWRARLRKAWRAGRRAMTDEYNAGYFYSFARAADFSRRMQADPRAFSTLCFGKP